MKAAEAQDEKAYQDQFRKTFVTDLQKKSKADEEEVWTLHDMTIPAGTAAKLVRVGNPAHPDLRVQEIADRLKFTDPTPVVLLAGAMTQRAGKTMAGIGRAAFMAGAVVLDSGMGSCIEKFCIRKGLRLVGICPESKINYPKLSEQHRKQNDLTNGHTHFIIIGKEDGKVTYEWGQESALKFDFAKRITQGRAKALGSNSLPHQKMVCVVMGDNESQALRDIEIALNNQINIIIVEGSPFCDEFREHLKTNPFKKGELNEATDGAQREALMSRLLKAAANGKVIAAANDSEEVACVVHLLLTISI